MEKIQSLVEKFKVPDLENAPNGSNFLLMTIQSYLGGSCFHYSLTSLKMHRKSKYFFTFKKGDTDYTCKIRRDPVKQGNNLLHTEERFGYDLGVRHALFVEDEESRGVLKEIRSAVDSGEKVKEAAEKAKLAIQKLSIGDLIDNLSLEELKSMENALLDIAKMCSPEDGKTKS